MPEAINPEDRRTVRYLPSGPKACSLCFDDIECETNIRPYLHSFAAEYVEEFVFGSGDALFRRYGRASFVTFSSFLSRACPTVN